MPHTQPTGPETSLYFAIDSLLKIKWIPTQDQKLHKCVCRMWIWGILFGSLPAALFVKALSWLFSTVFRLGAFGLKVPWRWDVKAINSEIRGKEEVKWEAGWLSDTEQCFRLIDFMAGECLASFSTSPLATHSARKTAAQLVHGSVEFNRHLLNTCKGQKILLVKIRNKRIRQKKGNWSLEVHDGLWEFVNSLNLNAKLCVCASFVCFFLGESSQFASDSQTPYLTPKRLKTKDLVAPSIDQLMIIACPWTMRESGQQAASKHVCWSLHSW